MVIDIKKLTNLDSVTVKKDPTTNNEVSTKKLVDESTGGSTNVRFNQA